MSMMNDNIRVRLLFSSKFKSILCIKSSKFWTSVNKKSKFKDWINIIVENFLNQTIQNIILSHDECIFPAWETCDILRENDLIYVDMVDTNLESNILPSNANSKTLDIENDLVLHSFIKNKKRKIKYDEETIRSNEQKGSFKISCNSNLQTEMDMISDVTNPIKKFKKHRDKIANLITHPEVYRKPTIKSDNQIYNLTSIDHANINHSISLASEISHNENLDKKKLKRRKRTLRKNKSLNKNNDTNFESANNCKYNFSGSNKRSITNQSESRSKDIRYTEIFNDNVVLNSNCYSGKHYVFSENDDSNPIESLQTQTLTLNNEVIYDPNIYLKSYTNLNNQLSFDQSNITKTNLKYKDSMDKMLTENTYQQIKPRENNLFEEETACHNYVNNSFIYPEKSNDKTKSNIKNITQHKSNKNLKKNKNAINSFEKIKIFKRDNKSSSAFNSSEGEINNNADLFNGCTNVTDNNKSIIINENFIKNKENAENINELIHNIDAKGIINTSESKTRENNESKNDVTSSIVNQGSINDDTENYKSISDNISVKQVNYNNYVEAEDNLNTSFGQNKIEMKNNDKVKNYEEYPVLVDPPSNGNVIAFKMLEIGLNYCPHVSQYKEAKVIDYVPQFKEIILEILLVNETIGETSDKFEVTVEDDDTILTNDNRMKENQKVNLCWTSLIQPRLIKY